MNVSEMATNGIVSYNATMKDILNHCKARPEDRRSIPTLNVRITYSITSYKRDPYKKLVTAAIMESDDIPYLEYKDLMTGELKRIDIAWDTRVSDAENTVFRIANQEWDDLYKTLVADMLLANGFTPM